MDKIIISVILVSLLQVSCNDTSNKEINILKTKTISEKLIKENKYLCYRNEYPFQDNPKDKDILELNIEVTGTIVTGEYNYLPAFKDKRVGNIEGVISNNAIEGKYTYFQEGKKDIATISIILKNNSAVVEGAPAELGLSENITKINCEN